MVHITLKMSLYELSEGTGARTLPRVPKQCPVPEIGVPPGPPSCPDHVKPKQGSAVQQTIQQSESAQQVLAYAQRAFRHGRCFRMSRLDSHSPPNVLSKAFTTQHVFEVRISPKNISLAQFMRLCCFLTTDASLPKAPSQ